MDFVPYHIRDPIMARGAGGGELAPGFSDFVNGEGVSRGVS